MNQREKIKDLLKQKGIAVTTAIEMLNMNKVTYYNNIDRVPINMDFSERFNELFGIDLSIIKSVEYGSSIESDIITSLRKELEDTRVEVIGLYRKLLKCETERAQWQK